MFRTLAIWITLASVAQAGLLEGRIASHTPGEDSSEVNFSLLYDDASGAVITGDLIAYPFVCECELYNPRINDVEPWPNYLRFPISGTVVSNGFDFVTRGVTNEGQVETIAASDVFIDLTTSRGVFYGGQVNEIQLTRYGTGDANRDGVFDSSDLVSVFSGQLYESPDPIEASWLHGDWTGDHQFDTQDLILAMSTGTYEQSPVAVPEPAAGLLCLVGLCVIMWSHHQQCD
jgi:hypothetical protein